MNKTTNDSEPSPRRAIIAGATGGIGSALVRRLTQSGWQVAALGRREEALAELKNDVSGITTHLADATDASALTNAIKEATETLGGVDAYVHCVGSVFLKPAHLTKDEEWHEVLNLNLHSAFYGVRAVLSEMQRARHGAIALCSSVAARTGLVNHEAIAAAKGGVEGLVRAAAASYAPRGIRINAVAPGLVETGATKALLASEPARKVSEGMHPLGRVGQPDEVASLLAWLVSTEADWVTGQIIGMDGGMGCIVPRPKA